MSRVIAIKNVNVLGVFLKALRNISHQQLMTLLPGVV